MRYDIYSDGDFASKNNMVDYGNVRKMIERAKRSLRRPVVKTTDLTMKVQPVSVNDKERGIIPATFSTWLMDIVKGSFGILSMAALESYEDSGFEQTFPEVLALAEAKSLDLEVY